MSRLDKDDCESSGDIKGSRERVEVIDVLMHQPVTQPPRAQPLLGVADDPEALGAVEVLDRRSGKLSRYAQEKGQEFVAQGVLQAGELGAEGLEAIDSFRRGELFREPFAVDCFGISKEPLRDCREVTSLPIDQVEDTRESGGEVVHRATPVRLAVSWIGFSGSLGPRVTTSMRWAPKACCRAPLKRNARQAASVEGLAQLDVQIDVSAARVIVHSGAEQPDLGVWPETLGRARLDDTDLVVCEAHAISGGALL